MYATKPVGKKPKLNLLDFRINKVAESYTLKFLPNDRKIIVYPNFSSIITAVFSGGKLGFTKQEGKDAWRLVITITRI